MVLMLWHQVINLKMLPHQQFWSSKNIRGKTRVYGDKVITYLEDLEW